MSDLGVFGWIVYFFSFLSVVILVLLATTDNQQRKAPAFYLKKIAWGIIIAAAVYWAIEIPYVGRYHQNTSNLEYPQVLNTNEEALKYIKEHQARIENLEAQLKETKEELRAMRQHYYLIWQMIMFGIIIYGSSQIFDFKNKEEVNATEPNKIEK